MYSLTHPLIPHLRGRVTPKQTDEGTRILAKSLSMGLSWWPLQIINKLFPRSYLLFPWYIQCRIRAVQTDRELLVPKPKNNEQSRWPCWTPSVCRLHYCAASRSISCTPESWLRVFVCVCFVFELEYWEAPVWSWGKRRGWSHKFILLPLGVFARSRDKLHPWAPLSPNLCLKVPLAADLQRNKGSDSCKYQWLQCFPSLEAVHTVSCTLPAS